MQDDANVSCSSIGQKDSGVVAPVKARKRLFSLVKTPTKLSRYQRKSYITSPVHGHIARFSCHLAFESVIVSAMTRQSPRCLSARVCKASRYKG